MALGQRNLALVERGNPTVFGEAEFQTTGLDDALGLLAKNGIIGLRSAGSFRIVEPRQYVGRLRLPGRSVTIAPRSPELFAELQRLIVIPTDRLVPVRDPRARDDILHPVDPGVAFANALETAALVALPFEYEPEMLTTARPRGRLNVSETVRMLHSRGIVHRVRCTVRVRRHDRSLGTVVRCVAAVLRMSDPPAPRFQFIIDEISQLFPDAGTAVSTEEASRLAEGLVSRYEDRPELIRLLEVALVILRLQGGVWDQEIPLEGGEARFCNMDRLWERVIWRKAREATGDDGLIAELHPFARRNMMLFGTEGPEIDPDVTVFRGGNPVAVLDAKYSEADGASADDVYQILSYTRRLKAKVGALVYLSRSDNWFRRVGETEEGHIIVAAGVQKQHLGQNLGLALEFIMNEVNEVEARTLT